ncbi:MAG: DNA translocase FtsK [Candidatus Limivicinus sp.]|nr:DNA translocase FtsK [Candidatus Limivicinus sp.]
MAQSKKNSTASKNSSKSKTNSKSKANSKPVNTAPPEEPVLPIRRELCAVLFLFLAVFIAISYFKPEGSFILFFANLIKGLVGWGYWLCAAVFLLVAVILAFHRGRPVMLRSICALLLPVLLAAILSLVLYEPPFQAKFDLKLTTGQLFESGQYLESAGVLGGLLAIGLEMAFSIYGALPVLVVAFVACAICAFSKSFKKVAQQVKIRATAPYDPSMYEDSLAPVGAVTGKIPPAEAKKIQRIARSSVMDIPMGDEDDDFILRESSGAEPAAEPVKPARKADKVKPEKKSTGKKEEKQEVKDAPGKKTRIIHEPSLGPTEDTMPLTPEEAAAIANVVTAVQQEERENLKPITMSGEISDPPKSRKTIKAEVSAEAQAVAQAISAAGEQGDYEFPPVSLLRSGTAAAIDARDEIAVNRARLEGAIRSFGINASIVNVTRGPTVTRYDIELEQGVKLARVTNLAGDLALALGVINVRIAPIPDKISTVGIEVPNKIVSTVYLRDIIESPEFTGAKSKLSFALGKDIGGQCVVGNIAKLPHMLIAGTTGSGKSVCMNSLILSLLYKARPDEVRLIMIDPKMVELGVYNGIPHLYVPVVTDPKKAAGALQWSVVEMLKRYRLFSEIGVRDLASYNKHCLETGEQTMPQVVIVIDELADLMLVASKEVEESICRVAQMGRAAGMHLIIATQRPSADVITGLMKANIPSRIAFAVSSAMESRIILDQAGAEKLVGMGDMLFSPVGCGKPTRIQGAFVSDEEREEVIQFIKEGAGETNQNSEIEEYMNKAAEGKDAHDSGKESHEDGPAGSYDEMLPQAVEVVLETKGCSVSMLQRRVKLGYSRAARIVDQMEELGIVGPYEGAKPRQVIIDREGWMNIQRSLGLIAGEETLLPVDGAARDYAVDGEF